MGKTIRMKLTRRVLCAAAVWDDLTGKRLGGSGVSVWGADTAQRPIRKSDGYYVFLDEGRALTEISAGGAGYQTCTVPVEVSALEKSEPVVRLRLTPDQTAAFPPDVTRLSGRAAPGAEVTVTGEIPAEGLHLLDDCAAGDTEIRVYAARGSLEGRTLCLREKQGAQRVTLLGQTEQTGGYRLAAPLKAACSRGGTRLLRFYSVRAGEDGTFFLPVAGLTGETWEAEICCGGKKSVVQAAVGRETEFDLTEKDG